MCAFSETSGLSSDEEFARSEPHANVEKRSNPKAAEFLMKQNSCFLSSSHRVKGKKFLHWQLHNTCLQGHFPPNPQ